MKIKSSRIARFIVVWSEPGQAKAPAPTWVWRGEEALLGMRRFWLLLIPVSLLFLVLACDVRRKSDAELGLTPEQIVGRRIYDDQCDRCHEPYSSHGRKGPSLQGVFKHQYLSKSGLPANDDRVGEIVLSGRGDMPAFSRALTQDQVNSLLLYLHTL